MITANFSGLPSGETLRLSDRLWQYDTGQQLKIQGLSGINENTEVHFALKHTNRAIVKSGEFNAEDTTLTVDIPNLFLAYADGVPAKVWVHLRDSETSARTIREIQIPVEPREKPDGYITPGDPSDRAFVEAIAEEQIIAHDAVLNSRFESKSNKASSIEAQPQADDGEKYPSVTAARNYTDTKLSSLKSTVDSELDSLDEAKANKSEVYTKDEMNSLAAITTTKSRNILAGNIEVGKLFSNGKNWNSDDGTRTADFTPVEALSQYTLSRNEIGSAIKIFFYDRSETMISLHNVGVTTASVTFTTPANTAFIRFYSSVNNLDVLYQLEAGDTATEYQSPDFEETKMQISDKHMDDVTRLRLAPEMRHLYVSSLFTSSDSGYGVTKFKTIIEANDSITDNCAQIRYTIHVADGTYTDLQMSYAGDDDSQRSTKDYRGVICKDYVYYEGNVQKPANCIIEWNGNTGFDGDITYSNVSKKSPFHLTNIIGNSLHTYIKGFTFNCENLRYCLHIETSGAGREVDWLIEQCIFNWGGNPDCKTYDETLQKWAAIDPKPLLGCGHSPLEHGVFRNCEFNFTYTSEYSNKKTAYLCHDNSNGTTRTTGIISGADIRFEHCEFNGGAVNCQTGKNPFRTIDDGAGNPVPDYNVPNLHTPYTITFDDCKNIGTVSLFDIRPSGEKGGLFPEAPYNVWKIRNTDEYVTKAYAAGVYSTKAETDDVNQRLSSAIAAREVSSNKVTALSSSSTDTQYPSAKAVYDGLSGKSDSYHTHAQYLTSHQSLDNYYTKAQVDALIEDLRNELINS